MGEERNLTIDLFKYIAALMIIAIHVDVFCETNGILNFAVVNIICRMAVPFFAICTGYLLAKKISIGKENLRIIIFKQLNKVIKIYIVCSCIYLVYSIPQWIKIGWFSFNAFIDYGISMFFTGSHYHLWYLISLIYALPLFYLFVRHLDTFIIKISIIILWIMKVLSYGYIQWTPSFIKKVVNISESISALRNGVICILPFMLLGYCIKNDQKKSEKFYAIGFCLSFVFLILEAFILRNLGQTNVSFIIFTLPTAFFMFNIIDNLRISKIGKKCAILGKSSMIIYCIHPIFVEILVKYIPNSLYLYIVVAMAVTFLSVIFVNVTNHLSTLQNPIVFRKS